MKTWYRVVLPYAVYAVIVEAGKVVEAAPIAKWMVGKSWPYCLGWITGKGGSITEMRQ